MATNDRITIDPMICHGDPVIRNTRVPVRIVLGSLAGGMTREEIQREYDVSADDVRAAEHLGHPSTLVTLDISNASHHYKGDP
jgi:uncharacterized protein (DUF433 family)